jgi:hypothetical protein
MTTSTEGTALSRPNCPFSADDFIAAHLAQDGLEKPPFDGIVVDNQDFFHVTLNQRPTRSHKGSKKT